MPLGLRLLGEALGGLVGEAALLFPTLSAVVYTTGSGGNFQTGVELALGMGLGSGLGVTLAGALMGAGGNGWFALLGGLVGGGVSFLASGPVDLPA